MKQGDLFYSADSHGGNRISYTTQLKGRERIWETVREWIRKVEIRTMKKFSPGSGRSMQGYFLTKTAPGFKGRTSVRSEFRALELCDSRGGRPGLPSLISLMVSVDVKQH